MRTELYSVESQLRPIEQALRSFGEGLNFLIKQNQNTPKIIEELLLHQYLAKPPHVLGYSIQQIKYKITHEREYYHPYIFKSGLVGSDLGQPLPPPYNQIHIVDLLVTDNAPTQSYSNYKK